MRKQIYISRRSREVWREAEQAARVDSVSLSDLTAAALREYLTKRRRQRSASKPTQDDETEAAGS